MPKGLFRDTSAEVDPDLEIGTDYVLGVWLNEIGVETVRMYRLMREGSGQ